jgi:hypothetical protein
LPSFIHAYGAAVVIAADVDRRFPRCRPDPVMQQAVLLLDHPSLVNQSGASSPPRTVVTSYVPRAICSTDAVLVAFRLIASG